MLIISNGGITSCNTADTMDAIMLTKNASFLDGVKLDVRESLDNKLILSKYELLDELTLSTGRVSDYSYDYLKKVRFPSHIFKYFIPSLEDVLKRYNPNKIIALELFNMENNYEYLDNLYKLLSQYPYQYIFLVDEELISGMNKEKMEMLGKIILKKDAKYINNENDLTILNKSDIVITDIPLKVYKYVNNRQK